MLRKAVDVQKSSQPKPKALAQQLFPSSSPDAPVELKQTSRYNHRPLAAGSGNIIKQRSIGTQDSASAPYKPPTTVGGVKRTSSGLEKALQTQKETFGYPKLPNASQDVRGDTNNTTQFPSTSKRNDEAFYDENDFESDLDLDVEDPSTMPIVEYPKLPTQHPESANLGRSMFKPTAPNAAAFASREYSVDSGYGTQKSTAPYIHSTVPRPSTGLVDQKFRNPQLGSRWGGSEKQVAKVEHPLKTEHTLKPEFPFKTEQPQNVYDISPKREPQSSATALPWSSSPAEHLTSPPKHLKFERFEYEPPVKMEQGSTEELTPRPTKRRTLPWLQQEAEQRAAAERDAKPVKLKAAETDSSTAYTPLPKNKDASIYPWNTTASAVKAQQRSLRQANKKLVKENEATSEGLRKAIEKTKKNKISQIFLSEEQQHVLHLVIENKKSVFFTGSAGTGKSVLLREIISGLRRKYAREPDRVAVTASTGLAACNVGGVTLHSFAGIGLGKEPVEELVKKIRRNQKARHRWIRTKILIVDEVSMVDGEMIDKLEAIARTIRNNGRPFGGIQLVITGDFFQLPPVPDSGKIARFAFDAGTWNTCIEHTIALHHVFRQKDPVFANMLNEMREGRLSQASISSFSSLSRPLPESAGDIQATELFPTRNEVDRANHVRMHALPGETKVFEAKDGGSIMDKSMRDKLLSNCMASEKIVLKKGAQVMLIKNIDDTLVNGSLGKVVGFMSEAEFDSYDQDEANFAALQDADPLDLNPAQQRQKRKFELLASTTQKYPLVRFAIADGTTRDLLCQRESWKVELPNGEVQASRSQIPLILAWALSIHKAQGQTLERVKVDLGKVFEKGQAYVALSRATSMQGLQVLRFDARKVVAHDKVRRFYDGLSRAGETGWTGDEGAGETEGVMKRMMSKAKKVDSATF